MAPDRESDITYATRKSIDSRLCKIREFRDFDFRVTSASTTSFINQDLTFLAF